MPPKLVVRCFVVVGEVGDVFAAKDRLLGKLGWSENPFVKDLRISEKDGFMQYYCPLDGDKVLKTLAFDAKACVLAGPKGVGKTSAMYYAYYSLPSKDFYPVMLKQPPASLQELAEESGLARRGTIMQRLFSAIAGTRKISRQGLVERMRSIDKKIVLFLDEAHLAEEGMHMEFKFLLDEVPNLRIVFSALGTSSFPDSLMHLVGEKNVFSRKGFSREEMKHIIQHRIDAVGGKGTAPFSNSALDGVLTEQNLFSPRYVFDDLNSLLAKMALGDKATPTQADETATGETSNSTQTTSAHLAHDDPIVLSATRESRTLNTGNADWWQSLSPSQQQILEVLVREGTTMTLAEISNSTGLSESTAFNCLYQLRGQDDKEKERKKDVPFPVVEVDQRHVGGKKKNAYHAAVKVRNLFTMH